MEFTAQQIAQFVQGRVEGDENATVNTFAKIEDTIATAIGEDGGTVEEVYEPFLIMEGFIKRTPRGRMATPLAYEHLGRNPYTSNIMQGDLFE